MKYYESNRLELKEKLNDKFIRAVVAFLNTDGGRVLIGVTDDGTVVGVNEVDKTLKQIADIITAQIEPSPTDSVKTEILMEEGKVLVSVSVLKGIKPIYCIKKYGFSSVGCPIRVGSTCREMTEEQIANRYKLKFLNNDLITEAVTNLPLLSFRSLKQYYLDKGYRLNEDNFETNLYLIAPSGKYNIMGELLSDNNRYSLIYVKFRGLDKASISQRTDYGQRSLIFAYEQLMNRIASENICTTDTTIRPRKDTYLYEYDCVKEAVINAIVHNDWLISEPQVSFYTDRLEVFSHGGLPHGLTKEEFFRGISKPRNLRLMKIFSDLDIVEHTGHGVPTIIRKYGKEVFDITDNHIMVTIPFERSVLNEVIQNNVGINVATNVDINKTEKDIMEIILREPRATYGVIAEKIEKTPKTVERNLSKLKEKGYVIRQGSKKSGWWKVIK
ncbi:MAG: Divergent AAA domain protein [Firmicutes bacterium ADurb.Bin099]|jgi:predicted HTH transcriptional regulator|nr:MAG: Divergent AAA domain protein [Firmicutes bacterium ADurb.Bin099]HPY98460.1 putative DNA binding domain-containing protein [Clostridia bacterium]HQC68338.1 putative DNA binding domain-containing protein [Clostridia bacterium]